ncbi:hypothetical protein TIFTF001_006801 [Ficus carica]|uniref:DUF7086 domain-containing protein n=1 Tax=Ficus carica TaxID=3494 RepID=A0AA87ZNN0_FICCA|nr:hypothetical protein TIFTF001_006801 [Ficus carica]
MVKVSSRDLKGKGKLVEDEPIMIKGKGKMIETTPTKVFDDEENDMTRLTLGLGFRPNNAISAPPLLPLSLSPPLSFTSQYLTAGLSFNFPEIPELPQWTYANQLNYQAQLPTSAAVGGNGSSSSSNSLVQNHREAPPTRGRRVGVGANPRVMLRPGKQEFIPAVYPWATTRRATVRRFDYLLSEGIVDIRGTVQCKRCEKQYEMGFDARVEFPKIWKYVAENKSRMGDRAPEIWTNPVLPTCRLCDNENSARPVIGEKKRKINWLFLLLGQLLGCCTLNQLKYFCKHSRNHRTGAKNRVLYLTYLGLCLQLDPNGPFYPLER